MDPSAISISYRGTKLPYFSCRGVLGQIGVQFRVEVDLLLRHNSFLFSAVRSLVLLGVLVAALPRHGFARFSAVSPSSPSALSVFLANFSRSPIRIFENFRHSLSTHIFRSLPKRLAILLLTGCSIGLLHGVVFLKKKVLRGATYCGRKRSATVKRSIL